MKRWFDRFASKATAATGSPWAFGIAFGTVLAWFAAGFVVGFSNELFQLAINTGTTIVTFLMVFLIQNTQNRDTRAVHQKLDELITHLQGPRDEVAGIERKADNDDG